MPFAARDSRRGGGRARAETGSAWPVPARDLPLSPHLRNSMLDDHLTRTGPLFEAHAAGQPGVILIRVAVVCRLPAVLLQPAEASGVVELFHAGIAGCGHAQQPVAQASRAAVQRRWSARAPRRRPRNLIFSPLLVSISTAWPSLVTCTPPTPSAPCSWSSEIGAESWFHATEAVQPSVAVATAARPFICQRSSCWRSALARFQSVGRRRRCRGATRDHERREHAHERDGSCGMLAAP